MSVDIFGMRFDAEAAERQYPIIGRTLLVASDVDSLEELRTVSRAEFRLVRNLDGLSAPTRTFCVK